MRKILITIPMVFIILFSFTCTKTKDELKQFQDFKWGSSMEEVRTIIVSREHEVIRGIHQNHMGYVDEILNEIVTIGFYFTPKTQKLYMIGFLWKTNVVGNQLLKLIEKKYGPPTITKDNMRKYKSGDHIILLELRSNETILGEYSSKYSTINKKEETENNKSNLREEVNKDGNCNEKFI